MGRLTRDQFVSSDAVWLLTLDYAGRLWRIATERVDVVSSTPLLTSPTTSETLSFSPGLDDPGAVEQVLASVSSAPDSRSVSVDLLWDDQGSATKISALIAQGHDLAAARGELALWVRDTTFEDRLVVVSGRVREPLYGGRSEPVSLTIEDEPFDDVRRICPTVITAAAFSTVPTTAPESLGAVLPFVFGQPGYFRSATGTVSYAGGSPVYLLEAAKKWGIAAHHVTATTVRIGYLVAGVFTTESVNVANGFDGLGNPYAYFDNSSSAPSADLIAATELWAIWDTDGALPSRYRSGAVRTLGELMRTLADMSSVKVDAGAWAALEERLPWPVGGYIDDPDASPLGYLQDALLPLAPVGVTIGDGGGLAPTLWRYDATAADAVDHLEVGPGVSRVDRVRYERAPREIVQEITVQWAKDDQSGEFRRHTTITPEIDTDDPEQTTSAFAIAADLRYRRPGEAKRSLTVETAIVWDAGTAARTVHWYMRSRGYSPRIVEYDVLSDRAWIRPGDVLTLTDDDVSISSTVVLVVGRLVADLGIFRLALQILDDLVTSIPETGIGANGPPSWREPSN